MGVWDSGDCLHACMKAVVDGSGSRVGRHKAHGSRCKCRLPTTIWDVNAPADAESFISQGKWTKRQAGLVRWLSGRSQPPV